MQNERGGIVRLFLFVLMAGAAGYVFLRLSPVYNLKAFGASLEVKLNRALTRQGITDSQVAQTLHRERSRWGLVWVQTDRRIAVGSREDAHRVAGGFARAAGQLHCYTEQRDVNGGAEVEVSLLGFVFQRVLFAPGAVGPAAPKTTGVRAAAVPNQPRVALVIDDTAYETESMDRYASLGVPLTFAILPRERHSKPLAEKAQQLHFAILLHLPMEPQDRVHNDPGPSALYLNMTPEQLRTMFDKDVRSVPHLVGINNHMGSAFTEDESKMRLILEWVKQRKLFFLDSRTSLKSVVPKVAKEVGVPCLINETFLDNADDAQAIEKELDRVLNLALKRHRTIAIGHYRRKHLLEALAAKIPEFQARGVAFVELPVLYGRQPI